VLEHDEARHEEDEPRDDHGPDHQREEQVFERKLEPREGVAHQGIKEQIQGDDDERDEEAVEHLAREVLRLREDANIVLGMPHRRQQGGWKGDDLGRGLEGRQHSHGEGDEEEQGDDPVQDVPDDHLKLVDTIGRVALGPLRGHLSHGDRLVQSRRRMGNYLSTRSWCR